MGGLENKINKWHNILELSNLKIMWNQCAKKMQTSYKYTRFKVLMAVIMKNMIIWDIMPYSLVMFTDHTTPHLRIY
jgi:hypothetical protein